MKVIYWCVTCDERKIKLLGALLNPRIFQTPLNEWAASSGQGGLVASQAHLIAYPDHQISARFAGDAA